jgi:plasmid stabilization system protein ParE
MTITRTMPRLNPFDAGEVDPDRGRMRVKVVTEIEILEILATHVIENLATHEIETEIPATATAIPDPHAAPGAEEAAIVIRTVMVKPRVSDTTSRLGSIPLSCWSMRTSRTTKRIKVVVDEEVANAPRLGVAASDTVGARRMIPVWERVVAFKQSRSPRCLIRPAIVREASLPEMRFVVAGDLMGAGPDVA